MYLANTQQCHDDLNVAIQHFDQQINVLEKGQNSDSYIEELELSFIPIKKLQAKLDEFAETEKAERKNHETAIVSIKEEAKARFEEKVDQYRNQKLRDEDQFSDQIIKIREICQEKYERIAGLRSSLSYACPSNIIQFLRQAPNETSQDTPPPLNECADAFDRALSSLIIKRVSNIDNLIYFFIIVSIFAGILVGVLTAFIYWKLSSLSGVNEPSQGLLVPFIFGLSFACYIFFGFWRLMGRVKAAAQQMAEIAQKSCEFVRAKYHASCVRLSEGREADLLQLELEFNQLHQNEANRFQNVSHGLVGDCDNFDNQLATIAFRLKNLVEAWVKDHEMAFAPLYADSGVDNYNFPQRLIRIGHLKVIDDDTKDSGIIRPNLI